MNDQEKRANAAMDLINDRRKQIDKTDETIITLLLHRKQLSESIAQVKKNLGMPARDNLREKEIAERYMKSLEPQRGLDIAEAILGWNR